MLMITNTNAGTKLANGGGVVMVNTDGSITATPAAGKATTIDGYTRGALAADPNSLIYGDVMALDWDKVYGIPDLSVKSFPTTDLSGGYSDGVWINPSKDAVANGGKMCRFTTPPGTTAILVSVPMRLPAGTPSGNAQIRLLSANGSLVADSGAFALTTTMATYTLAYTTGPATELILELFANNGSQLSYVVGRPVVTASGGTGLFAGDYQRTHLRSADLWHNGLTGIAVLSGAGMNGQAQNQHAYSRAVFVTDATSGAVECVPQVYGTFPLWSHVTVLVNERPWAILAAASAAMQILPFTLPAGTKRVTLVGGLQAIVTLPNVAGTKLRAVYWPTAASTTLLTPVAGPKRLVIYGDSISVGANCTYPSLQGWSEQIRTRYGGTTYLEAAGSRSLNDDAATTATQASFGQHLGAMGATDIWLAIGTNDYGLNQWAAAAFGTAYAAVLDALHAASPQAKVYCQTPIVRASEVANGSGSTLGDYRTQIATAQSTRSWATLVDGTTFVTTGDLDSDGIHPLMPGHAKVARAVGTALGV